MIKVGSNNNRNENFYSSALQCIRNFPQLERIAQAMVESDDAKAKADEEAQREALTNEVKKAIDASPDLADFKVKYSNLYSSNDGNKSIEKSFVPDDVSGVDALGEVSSNHLKTQNDSINSSEGFENALGKNNGKGPTVDTNNFNSAIRDLNSGVHGNSEGVVVDGDELAKKQLAEIQQKQAALDKLIQKQKEDGAADYALQIEDLKKQIAALKAAQSASTGKSSKGSNGNSTDSATANSGGARSGGSSVNSNNSAFRSGSDQADKRDASSGQAYQASSQNEGFENRLNGNAQNPQNASKLSGAGGLKSKDSDRANAVIVLSKISDSDVDLTKIPENPQESDMMGLFEKSGGEAFLIRENGILMKVSAELGGDGKPLQKNGKILFKKERLTSKEMKKLTIEVNAQRSLKEVVKDPTRKYKLDELMKSIRKD